MKEGGEKKDSYQDWTCTRGVGDLKQRSDTHIKAIVWDRGEAFEAVGECSSSSVTLWMQWEPNNLCRSHTYPGQDSSPLDCAVTRSWAVGIREQSQGEICCWQQGDSERGHEGGDGGGNTLEGKLGSHGGKAKLLSHTQRVEPSL